MVFLLMVGPTSSALAWMPSATALSKGRLTVHWSGNQNCGEDHSIACRQSTAAAALIFACCHAAGPLCYTDSHKTRPCMQGSIGFVQVLPVPGNGVVLGEMTLFKKRFAEPA